MNPRPTRFGLSATLLVLAIATPAWAAEPAAIVEDVSGPAPTGTGTGNGTGLAAFDYLDPGQNLTLPAGTTITLGYLASCTRETITGGKVTIGNEASTVIGGKVNRETVKCSGALKLTTAQAGKSGAMVFRGGPGSGKTRPGEPEAALTIHSTMPVFSVSTTGLDLTIERLDKPATTRAIKVTGPVVDLAKEGINLFQGGLYRARLGDHSVVFRVAMDAGEGAGPLLTRLIRL